MCPHIFSMQAHLIDLSRNIIWRDASSSGHRVHSCNGANRSHPNTEAKRREIETMSKRLLAYVIVASLMVKQHD